MVSRVLVFLSTSLLAAVAIAETDRCQGTMRLVSHTPSYVLYRLNELRSRLVKAGFSDVEYVIVNAAPADTELSFLDEASPDIRVLQATADDQVYDTLGASKDHILVIDSCNRLVYQVIMPWSILHYPYVKAAILSTYLDEPCGVCNFTQPSQEFPHEVSSSGSSEQQNLFDPSTPAEVAATFPSSEELTEAPFSWLVDLNDHVVLNAGNNYGQDLEDAVSDALGGIPSVQSTINLEDLTEEVNPALPEELLSSTMRGEEIDIEDEKGIRPMSAIPEFVPDNSTLVNEEEIDQVDIRSSINRTVAKGISGTAMTSHFVENEEEAEALAREDKPNKTATEAAFVTSTESKVNQTELLGEANHADGDLLQVTADDSQSVYSIHQEAKNAEPGEENVIHQYPAIEEIYNFDKDGNYQRNWFGKKRKYKKYRPRKGEKHIKSKNMTFPMTIILRSPHKHGSEENKTEHDYLVLRTDDNKYHGHLEKSLEVHVDREPTVDLEEEPEMKKSEEWEETYKHPPKSWVKGEWPTEQEEDRPEEQGFTYNDDMLEAPTEIEYLTMEEPKPSPVTITTPVTSANETDSLVDHYKHLLSWINYTI